MTSTSIAYTDRPGLEEHGEYFGRYVAQTPEGDVLETLARQIGETSSFLAGLGEERSNFRYAADKWSIKQVVGHLVDCERVFAYRALRFARGDAQALPGFEQDDYVTVANFDERTLASLIEEFEAVRRATLLLFDSLDAEAWLRLGGASGAPISVRAVPWILAGHELHHMAVIRDRYLAD